MNRLIIIGNGFDIAHGFKTSYKDFINWYCDKRVDDFFCNTINMSTKKVLEDSLCKLIVRGYETPSRGEVFMFDEANFSMFDDAKFIDIQGIRKGIRTSPGFDVITEIKNNPDVLSIDCTPFFETIIQSIETKGWVDIENDYYQLLKRTTENPDCGYTVKELNEQLAYLQEKLIEYLRTIDTNRKKEEFQNAMIEFFDPADFSTESKKNAMENMGFSIKNYEEVRYDYKERNKLIPERIMLLSFNYTATAKMYNNFNLDHNYIHGELEQPKNIIFGYGDELDKDYQSILNMNDNELLKNVKSVKYLETRHYHDMLEFLMAAPFQVFIMGHSCGNSDRTLLNTVFEHENCVSIKPFYHKWDDGSDNYLDIVQNISRNFTNMKLFRDRVVNKEQCSTM